MRAAVAAATGSSHFRFESCTNACGAWRRPVPSCARSLRAWVVLAVQQVAARAGDAVKASDSASRQAGERGSKSCMKMLVGYDAGTRSGDRRWVRRNSGGELRTNTGFGEEKCCWNGRAALLPRVGGII